MTRTAKATERPRWASLANAAKHMDCSTKTLRTYISEGELPAYYVGKRRSIKIDLNDVDAMMQRIPAVRRAS